MHTARKWTQLSLVLGSYTLLTACMMGPDFHSPAAPTTNSYTAKPLPSKTAGTDKSGADAAQKFVATQDIPADWWTLFHSEAIDSLIKQGLANSPNLLAAQAALTQAQENLNAQTDSLLFPAVTAQAGGQRQRNSGATQGSNTLGSIYNLYNTAVNVSYTFDLFGGNRRQLEALAAQVDYQRYELAAAYLTLTSNIVTTAVTTASLQAQVNATQQLIQAQQKQLAITEKQLKLGGVSTADVLAQQSQLAQTQANLPPLQKSLSQSQHALAVLVGQFPANAQLPVIDLDKLTLPTQIPVSLPSNLVKQRPDVQASEALLHQASAQVGVATANLFPQITLSGSMGWQANSPGALFNPATSAWNFGGQLLQPIFNGGALHAKKRAAVAAYEAAFAQYRQTVLQAFQNVADSLRALETDAENLQLQMQAEKAAKTSLDISQKQYKVGGVSYLALLNAQKQYQQALISRIQAQAARYNDTAALFQSLGGGWWKQDLSSLSDSKIQVKGA